LSTGDGSDTADVEPVEDGEKSDEQQSYAEGNNIATVFVPPKKKFPGPNKRLKTKQNDEELAILKTLAEAVATPDDKGKIINEKTEDDDDAFARFIATEMRSISDIKAKLILKNVITNAIFNTKMNSIQASAHSQPILPVSTRYFPSQSADMNQYNAQQLMNQQHNAQATNQTWDSNMYGDDSVSFSQMLTDSM
jgi:hypothetical protein